MNNVKGRLKTLEKEVDKQNKGVIVVWGKVTPEHEKEARITGKEILQIQWDIPRPDYSSEEYDEDIQRLAQ